MNYAYDEDKMMDGIQAFRAEQRRNRPISSEVVSVVVNRKEGCQIHGTANMRLAKNMSYICRICLAEFSRRNYAKNREKIKAQKREYYRKLRENTIAA